jgi:hypothetical protein
MVEGGQPAGGTADWEESDALLPRLWSHPLSVPSLPRSGGAAAVPCFYPCWP